MCISNNSCLFKHAWNDWWSTILTEFRCNIKSLDIVYFVYMKLDCKGWAIVNIVCILGVNYLEKCSYSKHILNVYQYFNT